MAGWNMTLEAIAADRQRLAAYQASFNGARGRPSRFSLGGTAVLLYRIARYLHINGWRRSARLIWVVNICVTGADLDPVSSIGKGIVIPHPRTVAIYGNIGENCTFLGQSGTGGTLREPRGLPVVGDNVLVMPGALIIGPTTIGCGARIGPRCIVIKDVPANSEVAPLPWRIAPSAVH
jgi:serine O-acetyltransferase